MRFRCICVLCEILSMVEKILLELHFRVEFYESGRFFVLCEACHFRSYFDNPIPWFLDQIKKNTLRMFKNNEYVMWTSRFHMFEKIAFCCFSNIYEKRHCERLFLFKYFY